MTIPFMVMSDAPSTTTGLARITRELLKRMRTDPETSAVFRVGTLGLGQRSFITNPYPQYPASMANYQVPELMDAWNDFAQGQDGVLFTIWNPSWLFWMPQLVRRPFNLWGYFPIDACGPSGKLPKATMGIINSFDRKLAYSKWAGKMIDAEYLPHGIDTSIFYPRKVAKFDGLTIGICATNTRRKDWGLAAETCAILKRRGHKICVLAKTDRLLADWHLTELFDEFGLTDEVAFNTEQFLELEMAKWYRSCDVTLAIGSGEGFGYPIAESMACGVPCTHGDYAGGAEVAGVLVDPVGWRYEGYGSDKRPVFMASDWADCVEGWAGKPAVLHQSFDWNNLWPRWKEWLLKGVK